MKNASNALRALVAACAVTTMFVGAAWAQDEGQANDGEPADRCLNWGPTQLPPCLPKNMPVPQNMQITASQGEPFSGSYLVQGLVEQDPHEVYSFYEQSTEDLGWQQISYEDESGNGVIQVGYKRDLDLFTISLSNAGAGTQVTIETETRDGPPQ